MSQLKLPKVLKGQWIWHTPEKNEDCDRLQLKYDFQLLDIPAEADLWLSSHSFFNVYINGRPCASGPIPHPGRGNNAYAMCYNITHMLEIGTNHIAILAHSENTSLGRMKKTIDGIWLQLDADNTPIVWTDSDWFCRRPDCYESTGLRTAPCDVFVELVDMRKYDPSWLNADLARLLSDVNGEGKAWKPVNMVREPSNEYGLLEPLAQAEMTADVLAPTRIACRGHFELSCAITWFSFEEVIRNNGGKEGLYVASAYVYSEEPKSLFMLCISDESYMLFVNNERVKKQAVPPIPLREALGEISTRPLTPQELEDVSLQIELKAGWNRIFLAQNCISRKSGVVMMWPDVAIDSMICHRRPDAESERGWDLAGPVNAPLALMYPRFPMDELPAYHYDYTREMPTDVSAFYLANVFVADEAAPSALPVELKQSEYIACDFGQTRYCFPMVVINGNAGDVVDIVCSEHCQNGEVIAYELGVRRNTSTLILRDGENRWGCSTHKGVRYIMVSVRKASGTVTVKNVQLLREVVERSSRGSFQCSSPVLEKIWAVGANTLETTMHRGFIDSPTKDQTQYLTDAMMQSLAAYYTFGAYREAKWSITAFADSQLDTGELNAASPSGLFQVLPDYSLSWPVWLHKHYLHTGDRQFLDRMMPTLLKLMRYYNDIALEEDGPLGDLREYLGVYTFLDHGDVDRRGVVTGLNSLYCRALRSASWLAEQADMPELVNLYANRADQVAKKVWAMTWDEEKGLFADCSVNGARSSSYSWQSNVLAIYGGIAKQKHYQRIWEHLFTDDIPMEKMASGEYNNPFFKYFVLEAAFALGKADWALRLIHYYWGRMVQAGATTWWEMFDPQTAGQAERLCSKCSGCAVTPNIYLISELIGVRPAEPGMRKIYFNPMPCDVVWARASVPTPHGFINVNWKKQEDGTFNVNINSNYPLEVIPVLSADIVDMAIFSVGDKVSILAFEDETGGEKETQK